MTAWRYPSGCDGADPPSAPCHYHRVEVLVRVRVRVRVPLPREQLHFVHAGAQLLGLRGSPPSERGVRWSTVSAGLPHIQQGGLPARIWVRRTRHLWPLRPGERGIVEGEVEVEGSFELLVFLA